MNYPEELTDLIIVACTAEGLSKAEVGSIKMLAENAYKLGLEKGWQYQQEEDNASRQWEDSDDE